ncbi:DUF624 domain-containing protein [Streptomyces sp. NPDC056987]|uniref:DUF624 domain-containing protein n=1 Tax=Streptomyces sp. NPDC056987 TaxID=3345988 RepID=UPI00362744AE
MTRPPRGAWWSGRCYAALDTACRYLYLSLLWTVTAAPLVTAPAAAAALVATVRAWAQGDEGPVATAYLGHLRRSARTGTAAFAILFPVAAVLTANALIVPHMAGQRPYAAVASAAVAIPFLVFTANLVPTLADGASGVRDAFRRTVERVVGHPVAAALTAAVALLAVCCVYVQPFAALLIAAPAARLVVAAHDRPAARTATTSSPRHPVTP